MIHAGAVPDALRSRPQWVTWRYEERPGDPKPTKVPYNARRGGKASSTDPDTWSTFAEALARADGSDGIGYVFAPDDAVVGIDLDHCRDPGTGVIEAWAMEILGDTRSYTEISPSGCGLHVFVRGSLPSGRRKHGSVEMYDQGRYFTVTGQVLDDSLAELRESALPLPELHAKLFPAPPASSVSAPPCVPPDLDDQALLERVHQAANGAKFRALWAGDLFGYPSPSEADLALCASLAFWTGRDASRMDRLFRQSGLLRPKWDERHGEETYGARTIHRAIADCREVYGGRAPRGEDREPAPSGSARTAAPEPIELTDLLRRVYPDEAGLVAGGLLIRRGLAVIGGAPKLGKSSLVLNLVLQRGRGRPWLGFPTTPGVTFVVQAEVPELEMQKRTGLMLKDDGEVPPTGAVYLLTDRRIKLDRPEGLALLREHIERLKPDLLVIDPLARFMVGDESGTKDMGAFIAALDLLIQEYDLAIIVVHHTGKPGPDAREGGHRLRGSSALFAAADSVLMLDKADDGFKLSFELRHGKEPAPLFLTRTDTLWFEPSGPSEELLAVAYLVASGPLRWGQFVQAICTDQNAKRRTAERLLERVKKAGLVAPNADGFYTATDTYRQIRSGGEVSP